MENNIKFQLYFDGNHTQRICRIIVSQCIFICINIRNIPFQFTPSFIMINSWFIFHSTFLPYVLFPSFRDDLIASITSSFSVSLSLSFISCYRHQEICVCQPIIVVFEIAEYLMNICFNCYECLICIFNVYNYVID